MSIYIKNESTGEDITISYNNERVDGLIDLTLGSINNDYDATTTTFKEDYLCEILKKVIKGE